MLKRKKLKLNTSRNLQDEMEDFDIGARKNKASRNRETNLISFMFIALFLFMCVYIVNFSLFKAGNIVNNPYNKLIDLMEAKVERGRILSADGQVLAQTVSDDNGADVREYPYASLYCHVVGSKYLKTGVERIADYSLISTSGNLLDEISYDLSASKPQGRDVVTSLRPSLQKAAYNALGTNKGAVIAMNPKTGQIYCMVSKPDYDPNQASAMYDTWTSYESKDSVLINRATQGLYSPGSTFKILTTLEYMRENPDYDSFSYICQGKASLPMGTTIPCYNNEVHGKESLLDAFANSCNSAYATLGAGLDREKFKKLCQTALFNKKIEINMDAGVSSFTLDEDSSISEAMETGIGQGNTMISPIHNLMLISAIANKGVMMRPYLVTQIQSRSGSVISKTSPSEYSRLCTSEEAEKIAEYARAVVTQGTGYAFTYASYDVAGKTGTAQFDDSSDLVHSWFVGFAPYEDPEISICVVLEGGYTGVPGSQQVAKAVLDAYFEK